MSLRTKLQRDGLRDALAAGARMLEKELAQQFEDSAASSTSAAPAPMPTGPGLETLLTRGQTVARALLSQGRVQQAIALLNALRHLGTWAQLSQKDPFGDSVSTERGTKP